MAVAVAAKPPPTVSAKIDNKETKRKKTTKTMIDRIDAATLRHGIFAPFMTTNDEAPLYNTITPFLSAGVRRVCLRQYPLLLPSLFRYFFRQTFSAE